jgi:hypothetical protein
VVRIGFRGAGTAANQAVAAPFEGTGIDSGLPEFIPEPLPELARNRKLMGIAKARQKHGRGELGAQCRCGHENSGVAFVAGAPATVKTRNVVCAGLGVSPGPTTHGAKSEQARMGAQIFLAVEGKERIASEWLI